MARVHSEIDAAGGEVPVRRRRAILWIAAAVLVLVVTATVVVRARVFNRNTDPMAGIPTFTVVRGPLLINITEGGTIKSRQQEVLKCEVEGGSTVLSLVSEGTRVKKGDLLIELDASKLQDQKVAQEIVVKNAEAASIGAEEAYEVAKSQGRSDIAKAELDARFAGEDIDKYKKGDYLSELKDKQSKVSLALEKVEQARDKKNWSQKLFEGKYISQTELQLDELAFKSSQLDLELAKNALALLENFTYKRKIDELEAAIEQTKMALERVQRKAKADIVQAEAARDAKKSEYERQLSVLAKQKRMIEKTKMYAPVDGLVVYASTGDGGWRFNKEPLIEGSTVRERQDLICLPTTSSVMAEVKIHESSLEKLTIGLAARVTVDALPGKVFTGRVARIAPLPDAGSMWMNPDMKVYNTEVHLDEGDDALRTGMSCRAEIIVDYYPDAVYVPVQAVMRVGKKPTVYMASPSGPIARPITLGLDNNRMVRIIDGLAPGEKVLLNPPLSEASASDDAAPAAAKKLPTSRPQGSPAGAGAPGAGGGRNLTPEQREEQRKRMEAMTPEQREEARKQREQRRQGQGAGTGDRSGPPGAPQ